MESFERALETACEAGDLSGAVLTAENIRGKLNYEKTFGQKSTKGSSLSTLMTLDTAFAVASCTKLITTIAALQAVERGLFSLDEDVTRILPELKGIKILTGFEETSGEPILIEKRNIITLRHLLSHSSGFSYDHINPLLIRYRATQNHPTSSNRPGKSSVNYLYPLLFEPGTPWTYGAGIDWAGIMTIRASNNVTLQQYMQENIWKPLGIKDMTFHLEQREDIRNRLAYLSLRDGGSDPKFATALNPSGKVVHTGQPLLPDPVEDDVGGAGLYAAAPDYHKVLHSICANDGKLLQPATVVEMFKPQLSSESRQALRNLRRVPQIAQVVGQGLPSDAELDWGLGGTLTLGSTETGRGKRTMSWTGMPNCFWWIDPDEGVCGTWFSALLPTGDVKSSELYCAFERAVYASLKG